MTGDWQKFEYDFSVLKNRIFFAVYSALFIGMCYGFLQSLPYWLSLALLSVLLPLMSSSNLIPLLSLPDLIGQSELEMFRSAAPPAGEAISGGEMTEDGENDALRCGLSGQAG